MKPSKKPRTSNTERISSLDHAKPPMHMKIANNTTVNAISERVNSVENFFFLIAFFATRVELKFEAIIKNVARKITNNPALPEEISPDAKKVVMLMVPSADIPCASR